MENLTQQLMAMNEIVGQVQYLTGSERQVKASMEQGGWLDNYLTELGKHTESLGNRIINVEEGIQRMNDSVRNIAVEAQQSHADQRLENLLQGKWKQLEAKLIEHLQHKREDDITVIRNEFSDKMDDFWNVVQQIKENDEHHVAQTSRNLEQYENMGFGKKDPSDGEEVKK